MGTVIVVFILVIAVVLGVRSSLKHVRGEGGCCGGSCGTVKETKTLDEPQIGQIIIHIDGMHCEKCKNSVESAINRMEGAVGKVNLKKNLAQVSYSKEPDEDELRRVIENLGFEVKKITKEA